VSSGEFSLTGTASHQGDQPYDDQGLNVQPAYTLLNASVSWTSLDERTYVELWGKNLTNKETAGFLPLTVVMLYNARPPRTYGVSAGYHW
jgi:iron complex outermembrane receptor protein